MTKTKAFFNFQITEASKYEVQEDGGLIVRDVLIMAAGEWVSAQGQRTRFGLPVLQKFATNWSDNPLWLRHSVGTSRGVNELVGTIINPRFEESIQTWLPDGSSATLGGCVADLYLSGRTPESRTAIELVQLAEDKGGIKAISAETLLDYTPAADGWLDVSLIIFYGAALVRRGACEACRLPAYAGHGEDMAEEEGKEGDGSQQDPKQGQDPKQQNPDPGAMLAEVHAMCKQMLEAMKGGASAAEAHEAVKKDLAQAKADLEAKTKDFEALKGQHAQLTAQYQELAKKGNPQTFQHNDPEGQKPEVVQVPEITRKKGDLKIQRTY